MAQAAGDKQPKEIRRGAYAGYLARVAISFLLTFSALTTTLTPQTAAASSWDPATTHIVYLTGTLVPSTSATSMQNDYQYIYRALAKQSRLNIAMSRQYVLNYTNSATLNKDPAAGAEKPEVKSSWSKNNLPPTGAPTSCPSYSPYPDLYMTDALRHAYDAAWQIHSYISNATRAGHKFILVGHSQGGVIARMLQLVATGRYPAAISAANCWPVASLNRMIGIVTMGTPLNPPSTVSADNCDGFQQTPFVEERKWLLANRTVAGPGKSLLIGAWPTELIAKYSGIHRNCSTNVVSGSSTRVALFGDQFKTLHDHTWYIEGKGRCPTYVVIGGKDFCGYQQSSGTASSASKAVWSSFKSLPSQLNGAEPGNVYDLISSFVKLW
jgi:hypothetical protein